MRSLNKVTLPNNHLISKCWHPHYHLSPFQGDSAKVLEKWHRRRYSDETGQIMRAVPLCVFGGVMFSPHVLNEHAGGTYAVCRSCTTVIMCGYDDKTGLGPRSCGGCGGKLALNDYFQPVESGSSVTEEALVDPERDSAMTIAEVCALAPSGIPLDILGAVIAILHDESLIEKGGFIIESLEILGGHVTSGKVFSHCFTDWPRGWAEVTSRSIVQITKNGRLMLKVRAVRAKRGAKKRVSELLAMEERKLQATGWKALANQRPA